MTLDTRIQIQGEQSIPIGGGAVTKTWIGLADVWASLKYKAGVQRFENGQELAYETVTITIRKPVQGVTPTTDMRVIDGETVFEIRGIEGHEARSNFYKLNCTKHE